MLFDPAQRGFPTSQPYLVLVCRKRQRLAQHKGRTYPFAFCAERLCNTWAARIFPLAERTRYLTCFLLQHLLEAERIVSPAIEAAVDVDADVEALLGRLRQALQRGEPLPWQSVLPLYPTSPVGPV